MTMNVSLFDDYYYTMIMMFPQPLLLLLLLSNYISIDSVVVRALAPHQMMITNNNNKNYYYCSNNNPPTPPAVSKLFGYTPIMDQITRLNIHRRSSRNHRQKVHTKQLVRHDCPRQHCQRLQQHSSLQPLKNNNDDQKITVRSNLRRSMLSQICVTLLMHSPASASTTKDNNHDNYNDVVDYYLSSNNNDRIIPDDIILLEEKDSVHKSSSSSTQEQQPPTSSSAFHSAAFGLEEYNNSIVASRDTNISPKEVYDTISSEYLRGACNAAAAAAAAQKNGSELRTRTPKALDVGAGAGVSTEILYKLGYHTIDALDWSGKAWERYVVNDPEGRCPSSVQFYELDDERYLEMWRGTRNNNKNNVVDEDDLLLFDAIVFNFAINESKAILFATELLNKDHGILLAPINTSTDYWLKQRYKVMDATGKVLWSADDVGAWSVLFQPDVTQDTCQGIWCSPYNGFQKK